MNRLTALHRRRLRDIWRSAGWPCQDMVEVELLAAGLLERERDAAGRETLRVTEAGIAEMAATLRRNRTARDAHEALVTRVVLELQRAGRFAWRGLSLRSRIADATHHKGERWSVAMPDVFSVRHTSVAGYLRPEVHEIKVRRSDLLSDLKRPHKRAAYLSLAGACWYVLAEGAGDADDVPAECGVIVACGEGFATLDVQRCAPARSMPFEAGLPFSVWMALARADVEPAGEGHEVQSMLGAGENDEAGSQPASNG